MNEKPEEKVETFDIGALELTNTLASVHQEGNFLVGKTDKGVTFRQSIPAGKILNKVDDKFVLQDRLG